MVKLTKVLEDVVFTSNTDSKSFDDIEIVDIAYSSLKMPRRIYVCCP